MWGLKIDRASESKQLRVTKAFFLPLLFRNFDDRNMTLLDPLKKLLEKLLSSHKLKHLVFLHVFPSSKYMYTIEKIHSVAPIIIVTFDLPPWETFGGPCQEAPGRGRTEGEGADAGRANFEGKSVRATKENKSHSKFKFFFHGLIRTLIKGSGHYW